MQPIFDYPAINWCPVCGEPLNLCQCTDSYSSDRDQTISDYWQCDCGRITYEEVKGYECYIAELEARISELERVLRMVEYCTYGDCPWCDRPHYDNESSVEIGHAPDCPRQNVLGEKG